MKTKVLVFLTSLLISLSFSLNAQDKKKNNKEKVTFDVPMSCVSCKNRIEKNIAFEKGVTDMAVNLPEKTVTIEYQTNKTDVEKLQQAFEKLGYEASVHKDE